MVTEGTERSRLSTVLFYGLLALLVYFIFAIFRPFLTPLGWAAVLVVVFYPWYMWLAKRWGETRAALTATFGVTLILIVPAVLLMAAFVNQGVQAGRNLQSAATEGRLDWVNRGWAWLAQHVPGATPADVTTMARQAAQRLATLTAAALGTVLRDLARFLFDLFVTIFALFYFFRDGRSMMDALRRILPFREPHREEMIEQTRELIFAAVTSSLVVAGVEGLVGGTAFALLGIGAAIFWGVVTGFAALLPMVGAWVIWVPAAIWLVMSRRPVSGAVLLAICGGTVLVVDTVIRPALIRGRGQLNSLLIFIGVLGGIEVFGMLGVVLGPIVVAMAAGLLRAYSGMRAGEAGFIETG